MKVLVTGASGFVGAHLVRRCLAEGHETIALVRPGSDLGRLEGVRDSLRLVEGDLRDGAGMQALARALRPELAIHLAWYLAPDARTAVESLDCAAGSLALLRGLDEAGCARSVFAGTYLEYAPSGVDLREHAALEPRGLYAIAKHAVHQLGAAFAAERGRSFAWARLFNLYGPSEAAWPLVSYVIGSLLAGEPCELGPGDRVRAYLHVDDAAAALLAIARAPIEGAVNVGSDAPLTIHALATRIAALLGRPELLRFGARAPSPHDAPRVVPDLTRLRDEVGFAPTHDLDEGLRETIAWWQARRGIAPSRRAW